MKNGLRQATMNSESNKKDERRHNKEKNVITRRLKKERIQLRVYASFVSCEGAICHFKIQNRHSRKEQ